jgi:cytochrome c biogenesis protein CcdA
VCPDWKALYEEFLSKNETINNIQGDYGNKVLVGWIEYYSEEGQTKTASYNITSRNSLMINGEVKIEGEFNTTLLREIFDAYIYGDEVNPPPSQSSLVATLASAFTFGFFETFSPCLMVLLSFVLSYTVGKMTQFKEGMLQVTLFGVGFVVAAVSVGLAAALMFLSLNTFRYVLTWIVCILAIIFGINLVGLLKTPSLETKPLIERLSRKYAFTYGGLLLLGFLFYFLDPCIAPVFVAMLPILTQEYLPLIILVFSFGVILPFIIVGVFASSISKLVRSTYKHKSKIRAVSGLILIAYALYFIIFYLL